MLYELAALYENLRILKNADQTARLQYPCVIHGTTECDESRRMLP